MTEELSLGWTGGTLPLGSHVCYYYRDESALENSLDFLCAGIERPEDALFIFADDSRHADLAQVFTTRCGCDTDELVASGKLTMIGGYPSVDELVTNIGGGLDAALARGHKYIRFLGFIAWGHPNWPEENELLEFESKVNEVVTAYPAVVVCTYGVPRLEGGSLIYGGLLTHPKISLGGEVRENSMYLQPGDMLEFVRKNSK